MKKLLLLLLIVFISVGYNYSQSSKLAQANINEMESKLDSLILNGIDSMAFPGAQLYISKGGIPIVHKAYGHHTYDKKRKVELDHLYDLASVTKVSSGLPILMKFYADGRFNLDAPLKDYYSKLKKSNKADLTPRQILTHQAGLEPYIVFWQNTLKEDGTFQRKTFSNKSSRRYPIKINNDLYLFKRYKKKMVDAIKKSEVLSNPSYKYSGLFFLLLPDIIKDISGIEFNEYLRQTFFDPLGADKLTYKPHEKFPLEKIVPTEDDTFFRKQLVHGYVHDEAAAMLNGVSCNAGLFSNAEDLAKLFEMYLNDGVYNNRRYLVSNAIKEFTKCQYPENDNRRGLGFDKPPLEYDAETSYVAKDASPASFGHSGFTGTFVWADPEHDLLIIFLSNRVYPYRSSRKLYQMEIRPQMHQATYDYLTKHN